MVRTKLIVSAFIGYHLLAIIIFPNPESILARGLAPILRPYGDMLAINTPWRFFAPNPGRQRYVEVEFSGPGQDSTMTWPPKDRDGLLTENYNRRTYHSILTTATYERIEKYFVPWVCQDHPAIDGFTMRVVTVAIPTIERANFARSNFSEMSEEQNFTSQFYDCHRDDDDKESM